MNFPPNVKKYLEKYSINNWDFYFPVKKKYEAVVVVPAIDEYENLQNLFKSLNKNSTEYFDKILILVVINNTAGASDIVKAENQKIIEWLKKNYAKNLFNFSFNFIDASRTGLELNEKDGGVGLARKIGMDLSLGVFDYDSIRKKIIICLDSDCTVKENYFQEIIKNFNEKNLCAAYVNYRHSLGNNIEKNLAIICYEIFLRYYVLGLKYASSLYAIHAIGSTMVCDYENYIKVEGMNKRKAAEDFYFMQKLAKITDIYEIKTTSIYPSGRPSWRVPFGTGQRVNRYLDHVQDEYQLYNPYSFEVLRKWMKIFNENLFLMDEYLVRAKDIDINLYHFLIKQNFDKDFKKILDHSKGEKQLAKQKKKWFDGFKTLKLIHYLKDGAYPNKNMFDALDEMLANFNLKIKRYNNEKIPPLDIQIKYLEILREIV